VVVEGTTFVNALSDYSSFNPGRFVDGTGLAPYSLTLDDFQVSYRLPGTPGAGQAGDFSADVTIRQPGRTTGRRA
jgi:cytochrome c biogenesis protein